MARPKQEEKRLALLEAASELVATQGLGASTAAIAKTAGVAEGTLFRYFANKDDLLNELYFHIKQDLGNAIQEDFTEGASLEEMNRSLWNGYIDWGIAHPAAIRALGQLAVSDRITEETRARATKLHPTTHDVSRAFLAKAGFEGRRAAFGDAIFMALADAVLQFASREPGQADDYKVAGFKVLWKGLSR